jgi:leucyl aminopeptidase
MKISFSEPAVPSAGAVVAGVFEERQLSPSATDLDRRTGGALQRAVAGGRFSGKKDETLAVVAPAGLPVSRILLVGLGKAGSVDERQLEALGGTIVSALNGAGENEATVLLDEAALGVESLGGGKAAARLALGARLRAYRFDKYRTKQKPEQ